MEFRDFTAGKDDDGRRLDRVLRIFLSSSGLGEIYKLLRKGLIKLNHAKAKPETHVTEGDVISIAGFLFDSKESVSQPAASPAAPHANNAGYGSAPQGGGFVQVDEEELPF